MILRSITKHVRDQNWFAVGLDFLIVVLGILLAFQITEWSAERQERIAEARYLAELERDLQADVEELGNGRQQSLMRLKLGESILEQVDPAFERPAFFPPPDDEPLESEDYASLQFPGYTFAALTSTFIMIGSDYTFDELVQSGNLSVLSDRTLVNQLAAYYGRHNRKRVEFEIAREQVGPLMGYLRDNGLGLADRSTVDEAIELARSDPRFLGFVKMTYFVALWQHSQIKPILDQAEATVLAVQDEIRGRS